MKQTLTLHASYTAARLGVYGLCCDVSICAGMMVLAVFVNGTVQGSFVASLSSAQVVFRVLRPPSSQASN